MKVEMAKCDMCITEEILKTRPSYTFEGYGVRPIWDKAADSVIETMCVVAKGDIDPDQAMCLLHLRLVQQEATP